MGGWQIIIARNGLLDAQAAAWPPRKCHQIVVERFCGFEPALRFEFVGFSIDVWIGMDDEVAHAHDCLQVNTELI